MGSKTVELPSPEGDQDELATPEVQQAVETAQKPSSSPRRRKGEGISADLSTSLVGRILVPVTTKLQPNVAKALRRATLEQRLKGEHPATQQDIVDAALTAWLSRHGYINY